MAPSQKQQQQQVNLTPCLRSFLENIKFNSTEKNTQQLIRRHQITHPHAIALATTYLLRSVVNKYNESAAGQSLFDTVKAVGNTLCKALEREMIVGNITRRVLTVVKEETEGKKESHAITDVPLASATTALASVVDTAVIPNARPASQDHALADALERTSLRGPGVPAQAPPIISMFHVLAEEEMAQSIETTKKEGQEVKQEDKKEGKEDDKEKEVPKPKDVRVDVIDGINEIIDELEQVDDQIAAYAPEHIHSNEVILTYGASRS
ncbi:GCD complex subunit gcd7, partial [Ascosphaera atra]